MARFRAHIRYKWHECGKPSYIYAEKIFFGDYLKEVQMDVHCFRPLGGTYCAYEYLDGTMYDSETNRKWQINEHGKMCSKAWTPKYG